MLRLFSAVLLAGSMSAVAAPVATAGAPTPKSKVIIPGKSIGGITVGTSYADLQRLWGTDNTCGAEDAAAAASGAPIDRSTSDETCSWRVKPGEVPDRSGQATVLVNDGKVLQIQISGAYGAKDVPVGTGPMGKFKTQRGGLTFGSKIKKVAKYYPKAVSSPQGVAVKSGGLTTTFGVSGDRIYLISLAKTGAS